MSEALPLAQGPILWAAQPPCPGCRWGRCERAADAQSLGDGQGLPGLWPGSSHFLWTGVLTLAPPTTHPHGNPHAHAPAPCVSQKPPLSCSAKNLGLAGSCGGPLECRFPVPAPVCQPWQSLWGRMGDHRISSGTGAAGGHEPRREGRADLPASSQVGDILYSGRPEPLTGSPLTIPPGVGERVS